MRALWVCYSSVHKSRTCLVVESNGQVKLCFLKNNISEGKLLRCDAIFDVKSSHHHYKALILINLGQLHKCYFSIQSHREQVLSIN